MGQIMMYEQKQKDMGYTVSKRKHTNEKQSKTLEEGLYRDIRIQRKTNKPMQVQPVIQKEQAEIVDPFISAMSKDDRKQQAAALAPLLCRIFWLHDEEAEVLEPFAENIIRGFDYRDGKLRVGDTPIATWNEVNGRYEEINEAKIKESFSQLMFMHMKNEMLYTEADYDAQKPTIIQGKVEKTPFKIFYTRRVPEDKIRLFNEACDEVITSMNDIEAHIAKVSQKMLGSAFHEAMARLISTRQIPRQVYTATVEQAGMIMRKARDKFGSIAINICCDSAGVTSIYGTSSNNGSTPAALMADSPLEIGGAPNTITVNFDACPDKKAMKDTLFHETAHLIGFNPTGVGNSGHFEEIARYQEKENIEGVGEMEKILFDAYFFEVFMSQ